MDERRSREAAVTGVAAGSLGTGTALDETQEWEIPPELQASTAQAAHADAEALEPASDQGPQPVAMAPAAPLAPVRARPVAARRARAAASSGWLTPGPRLAGIAAAVLLALVGLTAIVTSNDRDDAGSAPVAPAQPTIAPTEAPPAEAGGNGGKKDKDNGKGNGNGNGNGND